MAGGQDLCAEVQRRLGGRYQPVDIIAYINRGVSLVTASCPSVFDRQATSLAPANSIIQTNLDPTRKVTLCHALNGVTIPKLSEDEIAQYGNSILSPSTFKGVGSGIFYNGWSFLVSFINVSPFIQLYPFVTGSPCNVSISYHLPTPILVYTGNSPLTTWSGSTGVANQWIDDLVIDYAEAEIKRILNYGGWQDLEARFQTKIQQLRMQSANTREDTGDIQENQTVEQSKTQLGRT